jgi:EAL domain-containing protein (putative c-di-GMP-specific phosphodiesterase class I)
MLHSLVRIADQIDAAVIAEGVESEEEAETLRRAGTQYGQGYLFARPSRAAAVRTDGPAKEDH